MFNIFESFLCNYIPWLHWPCPVRRLHCLSFFTIINTLNKSFCQIKQYAYFETFDSHCLCLPKGILFSLIQDVRMYISLICYSPPSVLIYENVSYLRWFLSPDFCWSFVLLGVGSRDNCSGPLSFFSIRFFS